MKIDFNNPAVKKAVKTAACAGAEKLTKKVIPSVTKKVFESAVKNACTTALCIAVLNVTVPVAVGAIKSIAAS